MFRPSFREYFPENPVEPGGIFFGKSGDPGEEKNEQNRNKNVPRDSEEKGFGERQSADRECPRQRAAELDDGGHREKKGRDFGGKHCGNFNISKPEKSCRKYLTKIFFRIKSQLEKLKLIKF